MRTPLIMGNWKSQGSQTFCHTLLTALKQQDLQHVDWAVFPPSAYWQQVAGLVEGTSIKWGAQDISVHDGGAYTGEVSAKMCQDFGGHYAIVGHSERRQYHAESNELVAEKALAAQKAGLTPVVCIGESLESREAKETLTVLAEQLKPVLSSIDLNQWVLAYEPVWAIGTGLAATPEQVQEVHAWCRSTIEAATDKKLASQVRIVYGGSVKASNSEALMSLEDVDGALIGGASLQADSFYEIGLIAGNLCKAYS